VVRTALKVCVRDYPKTPSEPPYPGLIFSFKKKQKEFSGKSDQLFCWESPINRGFKQKA